jgi:hypothetical protein
MSPVTSCPAAADSFGSLLGAVLLRVGDLVEAVRATRDYQVKPRGALLRALADRIE